RRDGKGWHNLQLRFVDENTSGLSTGRNTRCPRTWSGSRAEVLAPNDRLLFVNSPWDWKHWKDSYTKNPFAEFTSAFSVCWRWKANRLTQGCEEFACESPFTPRIVPKPTSLLTRRTVARCCVVNSVGFLCSRIWE